MIAVSFVFIREWTYDKKKQHFNTIELLLSCVQLPFTLTLKVFINCWNLPLFLLHKTRHNRVAQFCSSMLGQNTLNIFPTYFNVMSIFQMYFLEKFVQLRSMTSINNLTISNTNYLLDWNLGIFISKNSPPPPLTYGTLLVVRWSKSNSSLLEKEHFLHSNSLKQKRRAEWSI